MKKKLILMLLVLTVVLAACGGPAVETTAPVAETTVPVTEVPTTAAPETETTVPMPTETVPEAVQLPLMEETMDFYFLSGAGAWSTDLTLNRDGSFAGVFHDSEMGEMGDDYPNGTVYICAFSGAFTEIQQISEYAYSMKLVDIQTERQEGEEWIEDGIRYVASGPHGLNDSTEFVLYLPDTPVDQLSEGFLIWWPYFFEQETNPRDTLGCFGILNVGMEFGFFDLG